MRRKSGFVRLVDNFSHKETGITVPIRLDSEESQFTAEHSDQRFANKDLNELKKEINDYINGLVQLRWVPVIKIDLSPKEERHRDDDPDDRSVKVEFKYERFYIAWTGVKWLHSNWDVVWWSGSPEPADAAEREKAAAIWRRNNAKENRDLEKFPGPDLAFPLWTDKAADRYSYSRNEYYLLHTEDTWTALNNIIKAFDALAGKLNSLVGSGKGVEQLLKANGKLLLT